MARLNGLLPKKPECAERGEGWALSMAGMPPRCGTRFLASLPHRMATSGPPRLTSAEIACAVTVSQPLPRWLAGLPGCTVSTRLSRRTPWSAQGDRSPVEGAGQAEVGLQLLVDVHQAARHGLHVGRHRERQAHRVPGRRVGVLPDDEHPHVVERPLERAQDVSTGRQVAPSGHDLLAQELAERRDRPRDGLQHGRPRGVDELGEGSRRHTQEGSPRRTGTPS